MAIILTPVIYLAHYLIDNYLGANLAEELKEHASLNYDENNKPLFTRGTFQDITEQVQGQSEKEKLEERLRQSQKMEAIVNQNKFIQSISTLQIPETRIKPK